MEQAIEICIGLMAALFQCFIGLCMIVFGMSMLAIYFVGQLIHSIIAIFF